MLKNTSRSSSLRPFKQGRSHPIQLESLRRISSAISQSLELKQILSSSIDGVTEIMDVDVALIFLLNSEIGVSVLHAHRGVSKSFVESVRELKLKDDLNQSVTETGLSRIIAKGSDGDNLMKMAFENEGLQSQVAVPLKSKGKVTGTLCVATRNRRQFSREEIEMLCALGTQIGIAVENAILYAEERKTVEQLRISEERYRTLFQKAHDAIWVHDMDGNIVSANVAAARLTGYDIEELYRMNVKSFLSEESLLLAKEIRSRLLDKRTVSQPYEQKLITKEGKEAILKLTTGLVEVNGEVIAFQHIARDVTVEKRMQESLRFHLGQITLAQEEERKRIARELHDETIQSLVVLARQLEEITSGKKGISEYKKIQLDILRDRVNNIIADVRRLSQDLRPPALDRLGLLPALEWLASDISKRSAMNVEVMIKGVSRRFSPDIELLLFRVTQEALRNTLKHSKATSAEVTVEFSEKLVSITVKDNGQGFYIPQTTGDLVMQGRLGLAGMEERIQLVGGNLKITSKPGKGTAVIIEAPTGK